MEAKLGRRMSLAGARYKLAPRFGQSAFVRNGTEGFVWK
jgi:hypothetical protein